MSVSRMRDLDFKRIFIKNLYSQHQTPAQIVHQGKCHGIERRLVDRTIRRIKETGDVKDRKRSGRPRSIRTKERKKRIQEKIRRNPRRSARKLSMEEGISDRSMRRLLNIDLGVIPYKRIRRHGLSDRQKEERVKRSKSLLKRHDGESVKSIVFSDEKLFITEEKFNAQNDRIYSLAIEDIPEKLRTVSTFQNKNSVMVWAAISYQGKIPLKFVDKGVKINKEYYRDEILVSTLKPNIDLMFPDGKYTFQQDSAPAHTANVVQEWCRSNLTDFIDKQEWPASSPDLNPLDYFVWGSLEAKVNEKPHRSIDSLKRKLMKEWDELSMNSVRAAIDCWRRRLSLVVKHRGNRFE